MVDSKVIDTYTPTRKTSAANGCAPPMSDKKVYADNKGTAQPVFCQACPQGCPGWAQGAISSFEGRGLLSSMQVSTYTSQEEILCTERCIY